MCTKGIRCSYHANFKIGVINHAEQTNKQTTVKHQESTVSLKENVKMER